MIYLKVANANSWLIARVKPFNSQNLKDGYKQNIKKMQTLGVKPQTLHVSESGVGLLRESSEYEMGNLRRDDSFNM